MPGLKRWFPDVRFDGNRVTPDEIDSYDMVQVMHPSTSATWFGTTAAGTAGQAKAYVVINKYADYPRNLAGAVAGSSDLGGTWVLNGKDQFGVSITETITVGTAANGGTTDGTKVFSSVTSGTFTFATASLGSGTPRLGAVTTGTSVLFGLPYKIASVDDIKFITWINNGTPTTLNGGTVQSSTYVDTTAHAFRGSATVALTDRYVVWMKSSFNNENGVNLAAM